MGSTRDVIREGVKVSHIRRYKTLLSRALTNSTLTYLSCPAGLQHLGHLLAQTLELLTPYRSLQFTPLSVRT